MHLRPMTSPPAAMNDRSANPGVAEARLAALKTGLDLLGLPACILDHDLRYLYVNPAYGRQAGRDPAIITGRTAEVVFGLRPDDGRRDYLRRALAGETVAFNRRTLEGPHQGEWFRAHYFPLREDAGAVWGVLVVLVDIQQLKQTEAALGERERQLSLITDSVGFPITYLDRQRVVRFVNRPSAEWAGFAPESMIGVRAEELMPREVAAAALPYMDRALAGHAVTYEREALWPGRDRRHVRGHMIPDRDEAGEVRGILIVLLDIEEDWRLRRALDDQRKRLQLVVDNIGVPMSYVDRDLRLQFANRVGVDWRAPAVEDAIGKHVSEVFAPEAVARFTPELQAAMRGEKRVYERQALFTSGERRWIRAHLVPDAGADGQVRGVYTLVIDVDHDHRLREALERQEAQLRYLAENIPGPIAVVDRDFRYVFANKVFQRQRGVKLEEIVGRHVREVLGPEGAAKYFDPFLERLNRGEPCSFERKVGPAGRRGALAPGEPRADPGREGRLQRLLHRRLRHPRHQDGRGAAARAAGAAEALHRQHPRRRRLPRPRPPHPLRQPQVRAAARRGRRGHRRQDHRRGDGPGDRGVDRAAHAEGARPRRGRHLRAPHPDARRQQALVPRERGAALRRGGRSARHVRGRARHPRGEGGAGPARRARGGAALLRREHPRGHLLRGPRARLHLREQPVPRHPRLHARDGDRPLPRGRVPARGVRGGAPARRARAAGQGILLRARDAHALRRGALGARAHLAAPGCGQASCAATTPSPRTSTRSTSRRPRSRTRNGSCAR